MDATAGFQLPGSFYQMENGLFTKLLRNACSNYLWRGFQLVVLVSGHNPSIQQNMVDEVCYSFKTSEGKEPVCFTMDYTLIQPGDSRRESDHAAGIETSMMLYLNRERVNMRANDQQVRRDLGVGGKNPFDAASVEEGEIRFNLQVEGLAKLARAKWEALQTKQTDKK